MLGAGVRVNTGATALISDSIVDGNEAWGFKSCVATSMGSGCGTETAPGPYGAPAGEGGGAGLWNAGTLSVWRTTISANANTGAGGCNIFAGSASCWLTAGAGIFNSAGATNLVNVTISGNDSGEGMAAAIGAEVGSVTALFTTIADNTGSPLALVLPFSEFYGGSTISKGFGSVDLGRSAVAGAPWLCGSGLRSLGDNVATDSTCFAADAATGDVVDTDPQLGALADNGGPTRTTWRPSDRL